MRKISIDRKNLVKRIAMSFFGVIICAISVGIFKIAALGVDPFQSLMAGSCERWLFENPHNRRRWNDYHGVFHGTFNRVLQREDCSSFLEN